MSTMTSPTTQAGREFLHDLGTVVRPMDNARGVMAKAMREQYDLDVAAIRKIEEEAAQQEADRCVERGHLTSDDLERLQAGAVHDYREALGKVVGATDEAIAIFRARGFVFDKWPVKDHFGEWTAEQMAALDPEVRWQGCAFTVYTMLAELSGEARALLTASAEERKQEDAG